MKKMLLILIVSMFMTNIFAGLDVKYRPQNSNMLQVKEVETLEDGTIVLDNIAWGSTTSEDGKQQTTFKRTYLKLDNVKDVYYISEKFKPEWIAAHGMIALVMKDNNSVYTEDGDKSKGIILSIEAWRDKDVAFDIKKGLFKNFKLIYMMYSYEGRINISTKLRKHKLEQVKIEMTQEQKNQLLKNSIKESLIDRTEEYYHSLKNSCVTNAAQMINSVLTKKRRLKLWRIPNFLVNIKVSFPIFLTKYWVRKGLGTKYETITIDNYEKFLDPNYESKVFVKEKKGLLGGLFSVVDQQEETVTKEDIEETKAEQDIRNIEKLINEKNID